MSTVPAVVALLFGLALVRAAGVGALRPAAASRLALARAAVDAVAVLVLVRLLLPWGETPTWAWWAPALVVVTGLAAAAARFAALPALDPRRRPARQIAAAAVDVLVVAGLLGLVLA